MIEQPFSVFRPYSIRVRLRLFGRADALSSDAQLETFEGQPTVGAEQTHTNETAVVHEATRNRLPRVDGLVTNVAHLTLHTRGADCQIFAVYDPVHHCGGVLHAGWRGLVAGAIPAFVHVLQQEWHTNPADLIVGAGPALCFACAEFTDPVTELTGIDRRFFRGRHADLPSIADDQWLRCGAQQSNMERHPDCTKCHRDRWWSLRGGDTESLKAGLRNTLTFSLL